MIEIRDVKKLQQDIENDPIIKDQMANLGCLLVCVLGGYIAPILVAVHTVNNVDLGDEQGFEIKGYEKEFLEYFVSVEKLPALYKFICCVLAQGG